ncbi:MAG: hypothetical protein CL503_01600 [Actinobacteria bacterium]|nr:hypothetical protein [Actinomycetota bacterium]|tara:strand:+ start:141 stop:2885 length:2745 start_codon:yes stop_codon:yes gene_type:complete
MANIKLIIGLIITGIISFFIFMNLYPDFLWFQSFGYESIWWFRVKSEWITWIAFTLIAFGWLSFNAYIANKNSSIANKNASYDIQTPFAFLNQIINQFRQFMEQSQSDKSLALKTLSGVVYIAVLAISVIFGLSAKSWWEDLYLYLNQTSYGLNDPLFGHDISFYLFSLPLFNHIQGWFIGLFIISLIFVGWIYFSRNILLVIFSKSKEFSAIKTHLISLLSVTFVLFAVGTWLGMFDLVLSENGVVYGAAFTDVNIIYPIKRILVGLFALEAILILSLIFKPTFKLPYIGLAVILLLHFFGLKFVPNIVQNVIVSPNELVKERPFIESNIKFTREAYNLNRVAEKKFPVDYNLTANDIKSNTTIVENIRLWNQEPLKQTFSQLQEIRLYYEFMNVDVDRYMINGKPQQVMLSARELDSTQLSSQAQTWTNRHLVYTHGYGMCMTPVNEVTVDGLPEFFVKDLPPVAKHGLTINRPEIYFGEKTFDYVVVNTKQQEFDFPKGDLNVYTNYQGDGGILFDSFWKRLVYAIKFSDFKLIFSSLIGNESRLMYDRSINYIAKKIAPFLVYDQDPYLVLTEEGRMKWIYDAYTISNEFPYSEPFNARINYIRNSVKVVIDAYDGAIDYYMMDGDDPLIKAFDGVYKGFFKSQAEMPVSIQNHVRYPKDLFTVQALILNTYHMEDPQVFYNREDVWQFPQETYEGSEKTMSPYYLVTKLPGDKKESFVLMLPFTPTNKNNMIAWLAASSDLDSYGQFTVLKLPKEKTIYGPMQIESRIDQDTEISKNLTLWGQMGSRVIRGNLMIIPIEGSLLYVEPIYLQAETSKLPELKRVIVSYDDKVVMGKNLMDAMFQVFDVPYDFLEEEPVKEMVVKLADETSIEQVIRVFNHLKQSLSESNWSDFGVKMTELDQVIQSLKPQ